MSFVGWMTAITSFTAFSPPSKIAAEPVDGKRKKRGISAHAVSTRQSFEGSRLEGGGQSPYIACGPTAISSGRVATTIAIVAIITAAAVSAGRRAP